MKRTTLITTMALALSAWPLRAQDNPPDRPPDSPREGGSPGGGPHRAPPGIFGMLDANHDGALDPAELDKAAEVLRKLDRNGDGRVTPNEMRPGGDRQRRRDAGPREPRRDGDRPQAMPGQPPGADGPRVEARRDGFGPHPPGDRFEGRGPESSFGVQRFAPRSPRVRDDFSAAGPRTMGPRFEETRPDREPMREQWGFAPQPQGPQDRPRDFRAPQPPRPPELNPPGLRFQPRPPLMRGGPERGDQMRPAPPFGHRPPPFRAGDRDEAGPPREQSGGEPPRRDFERPAPPQPAQPPPPPRPAEGGGPAPGAPHRAL